MKNVSKRIREKVNEKLLREAFSDVMYRKWVVSYDDQDIEELHQWSLEHKFQDHAKEFIEKAYVKQVDYDDFIEVAKRLDSLEGIGITSDLHKGLIVLIHGDQYLFVSTEGYPYARYKALLKKEDFE